MTSDKIQTKEEIEKTVSALRHLFKDSKIVTTNGAFDVLHAGHLTSLEKAKSFGEYLIVGLNSDESIRRYKSPLRPIIPQQYRAEMLAALHIVDYVVIFEEDDPVDFLKYVRPDFHVKSRQGYKGIEREVVESNGGRIELIDDVPNFSSTDIINKIKDIIKKEESGL